MEQRFPLSKIGEELEKISNFAWIVYCGLTTAGEKVTFDEVGDEVILDAESFRPAVSELLNEALAPKGAPPPKSG